ncbi:class I SAM-dependent methyltransferase [Paragemmobacter straminiformis]|uniref:Class I SAM-dependent methyltransferase n=1 Tax=Paragemmobacter straminiformis TaxID=2045119 RepID=A0A842I5I1_9RHOB|nr:class I SAM-dependent methyltransferase [Gemmobacter straminiformis]MBC2834627.1 class I SAM-dependent methyltransferase [Gemmobacter straminiformis]
MRSARLEQALASGLLSLPAEGRIAVLRPRIGDELHDLPRERLQVITGFRPDHDWFAARGYPTAPRAEGTFAAAIVCLPRAKAHARALLAEAAQIVTAGGPVTVDGQKTDGIDAVLKDLRARVALSESLSKAHGKLAVFPAGDNLADWAARPAQVDGFTTVPGVFSADGIDPGSAVLAAALPADLKGHVADLGAGWGYLSRVVLSRAGVKSCHLVEAEAEALDCARLNVTDERAAFHWADATTWKAPRMLDHIVMNPPFHTGRGADPALGVAFLAAAARNLSPQGVLWLVANRHLPYDRTLTTLFRDVTEIGGSSAYRLTRAALPLRTR